MHVRAFIMLLLWSKKGYELLKSNLRRFEVFSNNGLSFSFNCLFTSNIIFELRMTHDRKSTRSVSRFARADCSLRKARFTVFKN